MKKAEVELSVMLRDGRRGTITLVCDVSDELLNDFDPYWSSIRAIEGGKIREVKNVQESDTGNCS